MLKDKDQSKQKVPQAAEKLQHTHLSVLHRFAKINLHSSCGSQILKNAGLAYTTALNHEHMVALG